jgi:nicotinamidase-related amidase
MSPVQSPPSRSALCLSSKESLLLCVDVQERLCGAMPQEALSRLLRNAVRLIEGAKLLGVPMLVSEQYRRGLGTTHPELLALLPMETPNLEKVEFSAWSAPALATAIASSGRSQIVVMGMETHICVYQTVSRSLACRVPSAGAAGCGVFTRRGECAGGSGARRACGGRDYVDGDGAI